MLVLSATMTPSTQIPRESSHRNARSVVATAAALSHRNALQLQQTTAQARRPAVGQIAARCSRGGSILCQSSFSPARRLRGAVPAAGSVCENSSDVFLVNSWFDLPQVGATKLPASVASGFQPQPAESHCCFFCRVLHVDLPVDNHANVQS